MIKVASYCRVSTDKSDQANSFETQQSYFLEYIQNTPDWELYKTYADQGITGTSTKKRTQFNNMINDAYAGKFRMIITKEVSRFSRNILDTIAYTRELRSMGVGVIFLNDRINTMEPEAEMMLSLLASLAQEESRRTSTRVVWGQTRQMERGVVFGHSLLGYDVKNGRLQINEKGAEVVKLIFHKYAIEQTGTAEIARFLADGCYPGSTNWRSSAVVKILKNEKYVGDLIQKKTYTPDFLSHEKRTNRGEVPFVIHLNHHEPIVSREVWDLAQTRLQRNEKRCTKSCGHSNQYAFSGKIKCGECGATFVGRFKYLKDGSRIRRWSCSTAVNMGADMCAIGKLVRDDDAMQMFQTALRCLPMDFCAVVNHLTKLTTEAIRTGESDTDKNILSKIERIQQKRVNMMDSYLSGDIAKEDMLALNRKYAAQIENLRCREAELAHEEVLCETIRSDIAGILSGEIESPVFCKTMLNSIVVFKDRHLELQLNFLPHVFHFAGESWNVAFD